MSYRVSTLALVLTVTVQFTAQSQAPDSVSFQGFVTNPGGEPVTDTLDVTTTFYKDGSAGYAQVHTDVPIIDGVFNLTIGSVDTVIFDQPIDVGITIDGDPEIVPRTPLQSAPFALGLRGMRTILADDGIARTSYNIIGGASNNTVGGGAVGATIGGGGGFASPSQTPNSVSGHWGTIGGGSGNTVTAPDGVVSGGLNNSAGGIRSTVSGGLGNVASGETATIGGGSNGLAGGQRATIGGGRDNIADATESTVGGGFENVASDGWSTVAGGQSNVAGGQNAAVPGGFENQARGESSFAAGTRAIAAHNSTFVWSDGTVASDGVDSLVSSGINQFLVKSTGGVWFYSNTDTTNGVHLPPNMGSWMTVSSAEAKTDFTRIAGRQVLDKLSGLPIKSWRYKGELDDIRHMGPTAQDFYDAFGLGPSRTGIATVDADGVVMAAIQGLYEIVREQQAEIESLREIIQKSEIRNQN